MHDQEFIVTTKGPHGTEQKTFKQRASARAYALQQSNLTCHSVVITVSSDPTPHDGQFHSHDIIKNR